MAHGSVVKGGFIPGCSDIDLQLYLENQAFTISGHLPLELCLAIQKDLSKIDPAPFQYIQCHAYSRRLPPGKVGPIPGAYTVIAGSLPIGEATAQELYDAAKKALTTLDIAPAYISEGLLEHGGGRLALQLRWLCTDVWPTLYHVLTLQQDDPIYIWSLPKEKAIELLPSGTTLGQAIRVFYQAVQLYYPACSSVEQALLVIKNGVAFLQVAKSWLDEEKGESTA
ncbi:MAG: hypothetical protein M3Y76_00170 [Chloroflexota bacterium]|nr:hypothetical protein [Chloroflexota bacterium]